MAYGANTERVMSCVCYTPFAIRSPSLGHQTPHIHRWKLVRTLPFILVESSHASDSIKIIVVILARPADEEIFLLVDEIPACVFALFEIWNELNRMGRAGFLTHSTIDAAGKVNPEEFRITAFMSIWIIRGLKRDAIDGTSRRTQVARDTALLSVRISGQDDSSAPARR